jgi:hypothetical protein
MAGRSGSRLGLPCSAAPEGRTACHWEARRSHRTRAPVDGRTAARRGGRRRDTAARVRHRRVLLRPDRPASHHRGRATSVLRVRTLPRFQDDLFYRLHVVPIVVPPLRERVEDIQMLVEYFADKHATRSGRTIHALEDGVVPFLEEYH